MAGLKQRLRSDLTEAIRSRDELRSSTIRMALTSITHAEVAGSTARELAEDEVVTVLSREAKKRREAAEAYDSAGRPDRAERERAEGALLADYLPQQLSDAELAELVAAAITETGADSPRAMGAVMKVLGPRTAGRAEGGRVAAAVRSALSG